MKYLFKNLYILPLLGFLAAGCSPSSYLQTSETDDVYFSSTDKVTYAEPVYNSNTQETSAYEGEYSDDIEGRVSDPETYAERGYRANNNPYQYSYYDAPFGNPFYAFHDPFYSPARFYSRAVMMDPWMDPWYDPFFGPSMRMGMLYDPFWPRYGSGFAINIGMGWGRAYNPWGFGYGRGFGYSPYGYGYRGGFYDGYRGGIIANNRIQYAPRADRSSNAGRNPNISRDGRNNSVIAPDRERTPRSGRSQAAEISRPRSSQGEAYPGSTTQPARTRRSSSPVPNQDRTAPAPTRTRTREVRPTSPTRSEGGSYSPPTRRQRNNTPAPSVQRESAPVRSYEPPVRSSYEPSRSSSSSSGSSGSSGSSSGSGRRGRN